MSKPESVFPQPKKLVKPIKQDELQGILTLRLEVDTLKRQLDSAKMELTKAELLTMDKIEHGAPTANGDLACAINEQPGARRPAWKEEFAKAKDQTRCKP